MLTVSQPCSTPFHVFRDTVLNWPDHLFYRRAFETDEARIIKKNDYSMLFHATTKEFGVFNTHVYGRAYIFHHYVTVEFFLKQKPLENDSEVDLHLKRQLHFFKIFFNQPQNTLVLSDPVENIYSERLLRNKLNIIVQGLESISNCSDMDTPIDDTESSYQKKTVSDTFYDSGDINSESDLEMITIYDTDNSDSEFNQSHTGDSVDYICNDETVVNAFRILMINPTDNIKKIKIAYRKLSKENHPDRITNKKMKRYASLRFGEISSAYRTIIQHFSKIKI